MTLTPAQEVAQKLAQLEAQSQASADDAAPADAVTPAHDAASSQPAAQAQQPGANCCAASEYLPDRAVAYAVDQRVQYADYFGKLPVAVIIPAYNASPQPCRRPWGLPEWSGSWWLMTVLPTTPPRSLNALVRRSFLSLTNAARAQPWARAWLICVSLPSRVRTICCCLSTATWALVPRLVRC